MRLTTLVRSPREEAARLRDLDALVRQPTGRELRVCPGCTVPCPCSGSPTCTCHCGPQCPQAPEQLSSEGDRYPVEPKIVPLVFAFQELRVCPPCWSCEGHLRGDGEVFRLPQVWFYTRSLVYVRLLGEWLRALRHDGRIANPWHICVSYSESGLDTAFSLEPDLKTMPRVDLAALQQDVPVLASGLVREVQHLAGRYLVRYARTAPSIAAPAPKGRTHRVPRRAAD